jgi:hypothetical protein
MQGQELQQQRKSKHFFIISVYYRSMSTPQLAELSFGSLLIHSTVRCHTAHALRRRWSCIRGRISHEAGALLTYSSLICPAE